MDISVRICGFCRIFARFFCFIFVLSVHTILFAATEWRLTYDFEPSADELPIMHNYVSECAFIDAEAAANVLFLICNIEYKMLTIMLFLERRYVSRLKPL